MNSKQQGFTLIELMIVVAIIAILAAIAIPLYLNYTARAQGVEGFSLASGLKPAVVEYYNEHGSFSGIPNNGSANNSLGVALDTDIQGNYVSQVYEASGKISAKFSDSSPQKANSKLNNHYLTLSPVSKNGSIIWDCGVDSSSIYKLVPGNCRHTISQS